MIVCKIEICRVKFVAEFYSIFVCIVDFMPVEF